MSDEGRDPAVPDPAHHGDVGRRVVTGATGSAPEPRTHGRRRGRPRDAREQPDGGREIRVRVRPQGSTVGLILPPGSLP
ncbi:hypothetical protein [Kitasatospora sp. NBC_01266]|uniref:hypothetical protein n=1 Tax=Kitasatospora sp. NBC_01266 TaxID=2903572 RepID=UPI002E3047A0|nr:hypothetical protein [Kitasatospora sp. NBC_01266]